MNQAFLEKYDLEPKAPEVIDSSMLGTFMDCPSLFYLRYVLGLRPKHQDPTRAGSLDWGSCWHEVMFSFWDTAGTWDERIVAGLTALDLHYPAYLTPDVDKIKRSKDRMIMQFFVYTERWKNRQDEFEILRNEQYFDIFDDRIGLRWCGRIDSIRRVIRGGKIRVWDYKTTKQMGDKYFDQFKISFQFPGYVWAARHLTTEEIWEITVDVMYTVTPGSRTVPNGFDFFERTFRYDKFRLGEWERNVKRIVDRMMRLLDDHLYEPEAWEKNWRECTRYGPCAFFPVHSTTPRGDGRLTDLRDNYVIDRWDPAERAGEDQEK